MRNLTKLIAVACLAAVPFITPAAAEPSKEAYVLMDLGKGGDIFRNAGYARVAGDKLSKVLDDVGLASGDSLTLMTFGQPGQLAHLGLEELNRTIPLGGRAARPGDVSSYLRTVLSRYGSYPAHGASDLMSRLRDLAGQIDCAADVNVIILTNGREVGHFDNGKFNLSNVPDVAPLCGTVHYIGLWVDDPEPNKGFGTTGPALFHDLALALGASNVERH
ncbi:MAG: hypothetical protein AAGM84_11425 [Pseudomonadota bacterium]